MKGAPPNIASCLGQHRQQSWEESEFPKVVEVYITLYTYSLIPRLLAKHTWVHNDIYLEN